MQYRPPPSKYVQQKKEQMLRPKTRFKKGDRVRMKTERQEGLPPGYLVGVVVTSDGDNCFVQWYTPHGKLLPEAECMETSALVKLSPSDADDTPASSGTDKAHPQ